jgi:hypothetical protein
MSKISLISLSSSQKVALGVLEICGDRVWVNDDRWIFGRIASTKGGHQWLKSSLKGLVNRIDGLTPHYANDGSGVVTDSYWISKELKQAIEEMYRSDFNIKRKIDAICCA